MARFDIFEDVWVAASGAGDECCGDLGYVRADPHGQRGAGCAATVVAVVCEDVGEVEGWCGGV